MHKPQNNNNHENIQTVRLGNIKKKKKNYWHENKM